MTPTTPYSADLSDREPLAAMREAIERMGALMAAWTPAQFDRTYAPGKWTARLILIHLAQTELALGNRARIGARDAELRRAIVRSGSVDGH